MMLPSRSGCSLSLKTHNMGNPGFEDEIVQTHFLRVARDEMRVTGVRVPLHVSHRSLLERVGALGRAWRTTEVSEPTHVLV